MGRPLINNTIPENLFFLYGYRKLCTNLQNEHIIIIIVHGNKYSGFNLNKQIVCRKLTNVRVQLSIWIFQGFRVTIDYISGYILNIYIPNIGTQTYLYKIFHASFLKFAQVLYIFSVNNTMYFTITYYERRGIFLQVR